MSDLKQYSIECIDIECWAGTSLHEQKRLACLCAIDHQCSVRFVHNDRVYLVNYITLRDQCNELKCTKSEEAKSE